MENNLKKEITANDLAKNSSEKLKKADGVEYNDEIDNDENNNNNIDAFIKDLEGNFINDVIEFEKRFIKKYGTIKLFYAKYKLNRYLKKESKYRNLASKYKNFHNSLSLALISGFSGIKQHRTHLKKLIDTATKINN